MSVHFHDEREIINALVTAIFRQGLSISVSDGVKRSTNRDHIMRDAGITDHTVFTLSDGAGWFSLIHGNRCDVISDYSDNEVCNLIWDLVKPTVEYWEDQ